MVKQSGKCAFCAKPNLTHEHLWADWLLKGGHVPKAGQSRHSTSHTGRYAAPEAPEFHLYRGKLDRPGNTFTQTLRIVCKTCNSGWMSAMQDAAKETIISLMQGDRPVLDRQRQKTLAAWVAMHTMVKEFGDPRTQVTPYSQREYLRLAHEAPPGWAIWIGGSTSIKWHGATNHFDWGEQVALQADQLHVPALPVRCQSTAGALANWFFMSFSSEIATRPANALAASFADRFGLTTIWPIQADAVQCGGRGMDRWEAAWVSSALSACPINRIRLPWEHHEIPARHPAPGTGGR